MLELLPASTGVGVLHGGLGAPCPTQNFGWVATMHLAHQIIGILVATL